MRHAVQAALTSAALLVCFAGRATEPPAPKGAGLAKAAPDAAAKERAAVAAAESWLKLVDAGRYAESWRAAAEYFRKAVPQEQWEKSAGAARRPLGNVLSREVTSTTYTTSLPGAPDGEYVVIQYSTSFSGKQSAVETVTPALGRDGAWHVSGYFVR